MQAEWCSDSSRFGGWESPRFTNIDETKTVLHHRSIGKNSDWPITPELSKFVRGRHSHGGIEIKFRNISREYLSAFLCRIYIL